MKSIVMAIGIVIGSAANLLAQEWTAEAYGGLRFEDTLTWNTSEYDVDQGNFWGARILNNNLISGLSVGLEVNASNAVYTDYTDSVNSRSAMVIARSEFAQIGAFDFYGGIGLGMVEVEYDGDTTFASASGEETVFGGQVSLGARFAAKDGLNLFAEIVHQQAANDAVILGRPVEYRSNNVVVGVGMDF